MIGLFRSSVRPGLEPAEWLLVLLGSVLLLTGIMHAEPLLSANDRSRWATVWSLAERGTYIIDEIDSRPGWGTIDKVYHNGHFYSSKPPLLATVTAGVYRSLNAVTGHDLLRHTAETCHLVLLVVNWLPMVLSFVVFARMLRRLEVSEGARLTALATFCMATLVTGYATTLNNHSPAAAGVVFALAAGLPAIAGGSATRRGLLTAGFMAALTTSFELPAASFAALLGALILWKQGGCAVLWYAAGAVFPAAAHFGLNYLATGDWRPFYAAYGTSAYHYVVDGVPSYWMNPRGLDRNLDSFPVYLLHCTIGHHGIFSLTPVLLLLFPGWWSLRSLTGWLRIVNASGLLITVVVFGFYLSRTENYNYGGNSYGLRWMVWVTPLWIVTLTPVFERLWRTGRGAVLLVGLLGLSAFSSMSAARNPWAASWIYQRMELAGWIDYSDPKMEQPPVALTGCFPHLADVPEGEWVEFTSAGSGTDFLQRRPDVLKLISRGAGDENGRLVQRVELHWNSARPDGFVERLVLDADRLRGGASLKDVLISPAVRNARILMLLRGVPFDNPYRFGAVKYLRTDLRKDAFECRRAASEIIGSAVQGSPKVRHRCDLWLTDEIPFGTAQIELTELDLATRETLTRRLFRVTGYHSSKKSIAAAVERP